MPWINALILFSPQHNWPIHRQLNKQYIKTPRFITCRRHDRQLLKRRIQQDIAQAPWIFNITLQHYKQLSYIFRRSLFKGRRYLRSARWLAVCRDRQARNRFSTDVRCKESADPIRASRAVPVWHCGCHTVSAFEAALWLPYSVGIRSGTVAAIQCRHSKNAAFITTRDCKEQMRSKGLTAIQPKVEMYARNLYTPQVHPQCPAQSFCNGRELPCSILELYVVRLPEAQGTPCRHTVGAFLARGNRNILIILTWTLSAVHTYVQMPFEYQQWRAIHVFSKVFRPALGPPAYHSAGDGARSQGYTLQGHQADNSYPPTADVRHALSYTSTPLYAFMASTAIPLPPLLHLYKAVRSQSCHVARPTHSSTCEVGKVYRAFSTKLL
jgi:hypothetical protein